MKIKWLMVFVMGVCVGKGFYGQEGGREIRQNYQKTTVAPAPVSQVAAGYEWSGIILRDGSVWEFGYKGIFDYDISDDEMRDVKWTLTISRGKRLAGGLTPRALVSENNVLYVKAGRLFLLGVDEKKVGKSYITQWMVSLSNVVDVAFGGFHTLVLRPDGSAWGVGEGEYGVLPALNEMEGKRYGEWFQVLTNVMKIRAGYWTSYAIQSNHILWVAGRNRWGAIGKGDYREAGYRWHAVLSNIVDAAGGKKYSLALGGDGRLWATGDLFGTNRWVVVLSNVWKISGGPLHCLVILSNRTVWGFGDNRYGQLGTGDTNARTNWTKVFSNAEEVACGYLHSLVVTADGVLWRTGSDHRGVVDTSYFWGEDIDAYVTRWTNGWW